MLKKYISKFTIDILPSVLATIIGAYIVNHYIVTKPDAPAAAVASQPKKADAKPDPASADVAGIPGSGVKAKGVSEKAMLEKAAAERPLVADGPAETASLPPEPRHVTPTAREKRWRRACRRRRLPRRLLRSSRFPLRKRSATPPIWRGQRSSACARGRRLARTRRATPNRPVGPKLPM